MGEIEKGGSMKNPLQDQAVQIREDLEACHEYYCKYNCGTLANVDGHTLRCERLRGQWGFRAYPPATTADGRAPQVSKPSSDRAMRDAVQSAYNLVKETYCDGAMKGRDFPPVLEELRALLDGHKAQDSGGTECTE